MVKYYTRACNFYHGYQAKVLLKKKLAFPLCGSKIIAFDSVEFITRKNRKISSELIKITDIKKFKTNKRKKNQKRLKKDYFKKEKFFKKCGFFIDLYYGNIKLNA